MAMQIKQIFKGAANGIKNGRNLYTARILDKKFDDINQTTHNIHISSQYNYPQAALLPLPINIDPTETTRFSPQRSRDISATAITVYRETDTIESNPIHIKLEKEVIDPHVSKYDCNGAISLNSVMQSNVPIPYSGMNKFTHLNMPGGQWEQGSKFTANDLQSSHYTNLRQEIRCDWSNFNDKPGSSKHTGINFTDSFYNKLSRLHLSPNNMFACTNYRNFSLSSNVSKSENVKENTVKEMSRKDKLKKAVKDYGSTVIIFHVSISLMSLGAFYGLVSSGLDVISILKYFGLENTALSGKVATGASTFVIAYAVHKVFAPVRISITLGATPFIVRYLRKRGILKPPKTTA